MEESDARRPAELTSWRELLEMEPTDARVGRRVPMTRVSRSLEPRVDR